MISRRRFVAGPVLPLSGFAAKPDRVRRLAVILTIPKPAGPGDPTSPSRSTRACCRATSRRRTTESLNSPHRPRQ
jgi:hypothetical protein